MIQIFAHSSAGNGVAAYVEIWTPEILPCGSDKDPGKSTKFSPIALGKKDIQVNILFSVFLHNYYS